jgi:hypothetical protein
VKAQERFPFGQPLKTLVQTDRTRKRLFVLGVYASAVHARWLDPEGREVVKALAVASEPYIFWRGEGAKDIIRQVRIPKELGSLQPADRQFNGPSGIALDESFLKPLGLDRSNAWLCDLVPHSCLNPSQMNAIRRAYDEHMIAYRLPQATVGGVPSVLADDDRRRAILKEVEESRATILMLLGDQPIRWFLSFFHPRRRLASFGVDPESYGQLHSVQIGRREIAVLLLAHPRQVAKLGHSDEKWYRLHKAWIEDRAPRLLG